MKWIQTHVKRDGEDMLVYPEKSGNYWVTTDGVNVHFVHYSLADGWGLYSCDSEGTITHCYHGQRNFNVISYADWEFPKFTRKRFEE